MQASQLRLGLETPARVKDKDCHPLTSPLPRLVCLSQVGDQLPGPIYAFPFLISDSNLRSHAVDLEDHPMDQGAYAVGDTQTQQLSMDHQAPLDWSDYDSSSSTSIMDSSTDPPEYPSLMLLPVGTNPVLPEAQRTCFTDMTGSYVNRIDKAERDRPTCSICSQTFSRPADLLRHSRKHNSGTKTFLCQVPGCGYAGSYRKDKLVAHTKRRHIK